MQTKCRSSGATKTAIQALDGGQPALPLRPGQPERHAVECVGHKTVSLFATLEVHSGKVHGRCAPRHAMVEFVCFLDEAIATHRRKTVHLVLDDLAVRKRPLIRSWFLECPGMGIHFMPTYASWLN